MHSDWHFADNYNCGIKSGMHSSISIANHLPVPIVDILLLACPNSNVANRKYSELLCCDVIMEGVAYKFIFAPSALAFRLSKKKLS